MSELHFSEVTYYKIHTLVVIKVLRKSPNKIGKTCASGLCHSNQKYQPQKKFALFVQPKGRGSDIGRCQRWVHLMGRSLFTVDDVKRHTYVCEDHFDDGIELDYRLVR